VSEKSGNSEDSRSPIKQVASGLSLGGHNNPLKQSFSQCATKLTSTDECEQRVLDLLEALQKDTETYSNNLKAFEEYYLGTEHKGLNLNYVRRLLLGDGYKQRGLLEHAKDLEPGSISGVKLVNLVSRLLDHRRNPQAASFNQVFAQCDVKFVRALGFHKHIGQPASKEAALSVLHVYLTAHTGVQSSQLMESQMNMIHYERWVAQRRKCQNTGSTSPCSRGGGLLGQHQIRKQSSFLIESSKCRKSRSIIDLSVDEDDNKSDLSGTGTDIMIRSVRIRKQLTQQQ